MCRAIGAVAIIDDALHYADQCAGHLDTVHCWMECIKAGIVFVSSLLRSLFPHALRCHRLHTSLQVILFGEYAWNRREDHELPKQVCWHAAGPPAPREQPLGS